ncbi:MAG: DUF3846 domain-containing protein [Ruminococcaceae bacterium]|nr:DUF3846 domain-containing protein [Oscillospiraceae bacterium]
MDVLIVEPEKAPRMASIVGDLNSLQQVVGGYIEAVYPYDDPVAIVCVFCQALFPEIAESFSRKRRGNFPDNTDHKIQSILVSCS